MATLLNYIVPNNDTVFKKIDNVHAKEHKNRQKMKTD